MYPFGLSGYGGLVSEMVKAHRFIRRHHAHLPLITQKHMAAPTTPQSSDQPRTMAVRMMSSRRWVAAFMLRHPLA